MPRRFSDVRTVVGIGTALWVLGAIGLFAAHLVSGRPLGVAFTSCLAGALLGCAGWGVFTWQRAAARRGSHTAQQGIEI